MRHSVCYLNCHLKFQIFLFCYFLRLYFDLKDEETFYGHIMYTINLFN